MIIIRPGRPRALPILGVTALPILHVTALASLALGTLAVAGCRPASLAARPLGHRPVRVRAVWRWAAPPPASVGMPASDGVDVTATTGHVTLVLLGPDGRVRWQAERPGLRDVPPRFAGDLVLAATETGVAAFARADGSRRWDLEVGERANGPVVTGGVVVASTWEGSLVGIRLADGRLGWRTPLGGDALGPAATDGGTVVATWEGDDGAGVTAVDPRTGAVRWSHPLAGGGTGGPAVVAAGPDALAVVVAGDMRAHGFDLATGAERWQVDVDGKGSPEVPPAALPGSGGVLVPDRLGGLSLVDHDGRRRWRARSSGVAVRGGPAALSVAGPFAFPLDAGAVWLSGPSRRSSFLSPSGRVSGVAGGPAGVLLVATREAPTNGLTAYEISP